MRQAKSADPGSNTKANAGAPKSVDEYLAGVPEPARATLARVREVIRSVVPPEATEAISYGMPAFQYKGPLFGYAAFKKHCSLFPMGSSVIVAFQEELKGFVTAKGTIRFPVDRPPAPALIKKLVKARIAQNEAKSAAPARKRPGVEL